MSNSPDTAGGLSDTGSTYAFLLLRAWLGVRALLTGIDKFAGTRLVQVPLLDAEGNPDPSGAMVEIKEKFYAFSNYQAMPDTLQTQLGNEPLIPGFLMTPFLWILGPLLIVLGLTLLAGVCTRINLLVMGLLYTALTVGLVLLKQDAGVSWLAIHVGLVALALMLVRHNRYTLTRA